MTLTRFDGDRHLVVVASHGGPAPVGVRIAFERDTLPDRVLRGARAARVDDYRRERDADLAAQFGLRASVAAPITVAGSVWGMLTATSAAAPLPAATEHRLEEFAGLVGAALANVQARSDLQVMAEEQTALRRVADLVAHGAPLGEVFTAVATEASVLLGDVAAALLRYDGEDAAVVVAARNSPAPVGLRVPAADDTGTGGVRRTGRPVRVDSFDGHRPGRDRPRARGLRRRRRAGRRRGAGLGGAHHEQRGSAAPCRHGGPAGAVRRARRRGDRERREQGQGDGVPRPGRRDRRRDPAPPAA